MNENTEKMLVKFVKPSYTYIIIAIAGLICFMYIGFCMNSFVEFCIWLIGGMAIFVYYFIYFMRRYLRMYRKIKLLKQNDDYLVMLNDFANGGRAFDNSLILGDKVIIAKQSGNIYFYDEISRIYCETECLNGVVMYHNLYIRDKNGKNIQLYKIPKNIYNSSEMQAVYQFIASKNEIIKLGWC